jgi:hypothetical protein
MLHVRKTPTAKEQAEYEEWLAKHKQAGKNNTQKLTKTGPITKANDFWAAQAKQRQLTIEMHRGGHEGAKSLDSKVTGAVAIPHRKMVPEHLDLDRDQIEALRQRDIIATEKLADKMNRIQPAYNKGPLILMTEEDMESSVKTGANRRRN